MPLDTPSRASLLAQIGDLGEHQHGLVTTSQLLDRGVSRSAVRNLVATGHLTSEDTSVFRVTGSPIGDRVAARTATLAAGPGALVSHTSAAALWGLPGYRIRPLHVTIVRGNNLVRIRGATVHRHRSLARVSASCLDGIPIVRPEVLLLQLCAVAHPERAARIFDRLWSERLLSGRSVRRVLAMLNTRGLTGVGVLRDLLVDRPNDYVPPASGLEARAIQILTDAGLPPMKRQVDLGDSESWCGRVDLVATGHRLVLEIDSERYHTALVDVEDDRRRQVRLESAGFQVVRVTDFQVWHRPRQVVAAVRRALAAADQHH